MQIAWIDFSPEERSRTLTVLGSLSEPGSVDEYGVARMRRLSYEWLAGPREIVIDPRRCPLTFSESTLKEFEKDKEGNWIDEIPDGTNHSIDAVRYAMMMDMLLS